MKTYIVLNDGKIGYIKHICNCKRCKERGAYEMSINDLEDRYLDYIKPTELKDVLYIGESIHDAVSALVRYYENQIADKDMINNSLQNLINSYDKLLLIKEKSENDNNSIKIKGDGITDNTEVIQRAKKYLDSL